MIDNKIVRGVAALLACLGATGVVPGVAGASFADGVAPVAVGTPASALLGLPEVPRVQAEAFGALRRPPAATLPAQMKAVFDSLASDELGKMGVDSLQARRVAANDRPFYVVPGSKALCLFAPTGAACAKDLDWVARHGFSSP